MLDELSVRNLGVIATARIEPGSGLVVVSGETGAGKTMLLGALELLSGLPARASVVGPEGDEAVVEGRFLSADGKEVVVARRVRSEGRSRAYLDGDMATLKEISAAMVGLVEIVSQHDHLALGTESEVRGLVDRALDPQGQACLMAYENAWSTFSGVDARRRAIEADPGSLERERDLVVWQATEIGEAAFSSDDDVTLASLVSKLRNAEQLTDSLSTSHEAGATARDAWGVVVDSIRTAVTMDPELSQLGAEVESIADLLSEAVSSMRSAGEEVLHDPDELALAEERIRVLSDLKRKYGPTMSEVLAFAEAASLRAHEIDNLMAQADSLVEAWQSASAAVHVAGEQLWEARSVAAASLAHDAIGHLRELGFSDPVVLVEVEPAEARSQGCDKIRLLFASDSRLDPGPVSRVASGGELSRLVLALRLAGGVGEAPVIAFDEIDAGVGGRTALELGRKLAELSRDRQVLVVTHLPQVAAFADAHLVVEREGATAIVQALDEEGQIAELSRMLAGLDDSPEGREHAIELRRTALAQLAGET